MTWFTRLRAWWTVRHQRALQLDYHPRLESLRRLQATQERAERRRTEIRQLRVIEGRKVA